MRYSTSIPSLEAIPPCGRPSRLLAKQASFLSAVGFIMFHTFSKGPKDLINGYLGL